MSEVSTQLSIGKYMNQPKIQERIKEVIGDNIGVFTASLVTIANGSSKLMSADPATLVGAGITAAALDLPIGNELGLAYIVPYDVSVPDGKGGWTKKTVAQFQIGYKGHKQLAMRTGQYKTIKVGGIYEGQLIDNNPMEGPKFDWNNKKSDTVIGYFGFYRLLNGFEETMFVPIEDIVAHGKKYSKSFSNPKSEWQKNFPSMAFKTMVLKLLNMGPKSVKYQSLASRDQAVIEELGDGAKVKYLDNPETSKPKNDTTVGNDVADAIIDKVTDEHDNIDAKSPDDMNQDNGISEVEVVVEEQAGDGVQEPEKTQEPSAQVDKFIVPEAGKRDSNAQGTIYKRMRELRLTAEDMSDVKKKAIELGMDLSYLGDDFDTQKFLTSAKAQDVQDILDL